MRTTTVGGIEVTPLSDCELRVPPTELLEKPHWQRWPPDLLDEDGLMGVNFGGFLLRTSSHLVVVDTGVGGGARPELPTGSFPTRLAQAGVTPDRVDTVIFSHLHFETVGWSSDGENPMFENALHHCHTLEWDYWCGAEGHAETSPLQDAFGAIPAPERLAPLADQLVRHAGESTEIVPGVTLRLAAGHTPGHCTVGLGSIQAWLLGDAAYNPIHLLHSHWCARSDEDPEVASQTRERLADQLNDSAISATMTHDPGNRFGEVKGHPFAPGYARWAYD